MDSQYVFYSNFRWNLLISNNSADNTPVGRSWQTMTSILTGREEGGLLLYGGFDNELTALGDCWRLDLQQQPSTWVNCPHLERGPRLWHASISLDDSQVMVAGGLTNNILAPNYVSKHHAEKVRHLSCLCHVGHPLKPCLGLDLIDCSRTSFIYCVCLGLIPESCSTQSVEVVPRINNQEQRSAP